MNDNQFDQFGERKSGSYLFRQGAIFGAIAGFVPLVFGVINFQLTDNISWFLAWALLVTISGLLSGGIGGLIIGKNWKSVTAARIGGIISALLFFFIMRTPTFYFFFLFTCLGSGTC